MVSSIGLPSGLSPRIWTCVGFGAVNPISSLTLMRAACAKRKLWCSSSIMLPSKSTAWQVCWWESRSQQLASGNCVCIASSWEVSLACSALACSRVTWSPTIRAIFCSASSSSTNIFPRAKLSVVAMRVAKCSGLKILKVGWSLQPVCANTAHSGNPSWSLSRDGSNQTKQVSCNGG